MFYIRLITKKSSKSVTLKIFSSVLEKKLLFCIFSESLVNGVPASGVDVPVVGRVFVAAYSNFCSFYFFVSVYTHDTC